MVEFNETPDTLLDPGNTAEFDNRRAVSGPQSMPYTVLVVGQRMASGSVAALVAKRVTAIEQAEAYWGANAQITAMLRAFLANNDFTEVVGVALDDDAAAAPAAGSVTFGGPATASGTLYLYIAGRRCKVGVTAGQTAASIATAVAAAVTADTRMPVAAVVDGVDTTKVNLTARNEGETGNGIDVRLNYYDGEALPAGVTVTFSEGAGIVDGGPNPPWEWAAATAANVAYYGNIDQARPFKTLPLLGILAPKESAGMLLAGGTGNPDLAPVWAALGDTHYHVAVTPYTDAANLVSLETELLDRFGPLRQIEGVAFAAAYGDLSALGTLGDSRNSQFVSIMDATGGRTKQERNLLNYDGISTHEVGADGTVRIKLLVTTYKTNAAGAADRSYLKVNTMLTLGYLRWDWRGYIDRKYPRHKLAGDRYRGKNAMTPKTAKAEAVAWFRGMEEDKGLVEDLGQFGADLVAEIHAGNTDRLDMLLAPNLVNQFEQLATVIQFRL